MKTSKYNANTQLEEIFVLLYCAYPNWVTTHEIREWTYAVDVPKNRSKLQKLGIFVKSDTTGYKLNKFGNLVKVTSYRLDDISIKKAHEWSKELEKKTIDKQTAKRLQPV